MYLEIGTRRTFVGAVAWPGWMRSGRDEAAALGALREVVPRYGLVAAQAGLPFEVREDDTLVVVDRVVGDATTDFGAPGRVPTLDAAPLSGAEAERLVSLVAASWTVLDRVVTTAPPVLRKGPRGGGRDRDAIAQHVLAAEQSYARKVGVKVREPRLGDDDAVAGMRAAILDVLRSSRGGPVVEKGWPARYAARRIAWHVLDHAWEIEDKST